MKPDVAVEKRLSAEAKSVEQGASTQVLLAASPLAEGICRRYFYDNKEAQVVGSMAARTASIRPVILTMSGRMLSTLTSPLTSGICLWICSCSGTSLKIINSKIIRKL